MRLRSRSESTITYSAPGSAAAVDIPISFAPKCRAPGGSAGRVRSHAPSSLATVRDGRAEREPADAYEPVSPSIASRHENTAATASDETNTGDSPPVDATVIRQRA